MTNDNQEEIIALLEQTIQQLDGIVEKLKAGSLEQLPAKTVVESLAAKTAALAAVLEEPIPEEEEKSTPVIFEAEERFPTPTETLAETIPAEEEFEEGEAEISLAESSWLDRFLPSFSSLQAWWDGILNGVRSLFPPSVQAKLSDWVLTAILSTIAVALLLTSVLLLPKPATEVAETPPEAIETPPELKAPARPKPIEIAPPPEPILTPEQSLIAAIQEEVTALTSQYPQGLLLSVEADFLGSRLIVTVGEDWYKLSSGRQDRLANNILQRSRQLNFRKLEIVSSQGNLLARNPVVGKDMVILQREN
jgi:hypothetical protein